MRIEAFEIPRELSVFIVDGSYKKIHAPYSGASTYRVELATGLSAFLKILPVPHREPLKQYQEKLLWLNEKLPVPKPLFYSYDLCYEYLLMSEIAGKDGTDPVHKENTGLLIRKLAQALKQVHRVDISDCPFDYTLSKQLKIIKQKTEDGRIDKRKFEEQFRDESFEALYQMLLAKHSAEEDLVFTHGDYSVPNVMFDDDHITGFIDLADAGIADRYRDLAVAHHSIIRNFGEGWTELFYEEYGITNVNFEKIKFYGVLEAFYCL